MMVLTSFRLLIKAVSIRTELGNICKESTAWLEMYLKRAEAIISDQDKNTLLRWIIGSNAFDQFLLSKFPTETRGITCEMLIPAVKALLSQANALGVTSFVIGIKSSQSSLNILGSGLYVPVLPMIASKLRHDKTPLKPMDNVVLLVRNQLDRLAHDVVCGKTRAEQINQQDFLNRQVWTIVVNTDNPLDCCSGSLETSRVSSDNSLTVGGVVHLLVTSEKVGTSWLRRPLAHLDPIIHVDAADPEAVLYVMKTAALFRHLFQEDIFINLEHIIPSHTVSSNIAIILDQLKLNKPVMKNFCQQLIDENLTTARDIVETVSEYQLWFNEQYHLAEKEVKGITHWFRNKLFHVRLSKKESKKGFSFEVTESELESLIEHIEQGWILDSCHKDVGQIISKRIELARKGKITWTMAEMLAIAHLLKQNISVRMSGTDLNNNQYSERHYWFWNQKSGVSVKPFADMFDNGAQFSMCESRCLSSEAKLAYELGASQNKSITVWESSSSELSSLQYTLDRFLSMNGHWYQRSNLVILLPHDPTLPGQSTRPSRVLDLCRLDGPPNWTVANVSSPANYFHLLIKQVNSATPLVIFSHRTLLKENVVSLKEEFFQKEFQCYLPEEKDNCNDIVRVLVCTGRLYHELMDVRQARSMSSLVAISRLEQLYPFPRRELAADISRFRHASVHWVQEEPGSRGWWDWVAPNMREALKNIKFDLHLIKPHGGSNTECLVHSRTDIINSALSIY